jgi:tripartite-type tricarboxylate transporter receptor subunit TctC
MKWLCNPIAALLLLVSPALAQTNYPEQTVRILVGFPAGTAPDVAARVVGDKLALSLGKPVVVENISGERQHRVRPRRQVGAGRLHAGDVR